MRHTYNILSSFYFRFYSLPSISQKKLLQLLIFVLKELLYLLKINVCYRVCKSTPLFSLITAFVNPLSYQSAKLNNNTPDDFNLLLPSKNSFILGSTYPVVV